MSEKSERSKKKGPVEEERSVLLDGGFLSQVVEIDEVSAALLLSPAEIEGTDQSVLFPFISIGAQVNSTFYPDTPTRELAEIVSLGTATALLGDLAEGLQGSLEKLGLMSNTALPLDRGQIELATEMLQNAEKKIVESLELLKSIKGG